MLAEAILSAAVEGLITVAGGAAVTAMGKGRQERAAQLPGWAEISDPDGLRQPIQRAILAAQIDEASARALDDFFQSPSGALLARYVAIDVLTDGDSRAEATIRRHAAALLRLNPGTRRISEDLVARLVRTMGYAVKNSIGAVERTDSANAARIRESARAERQALVLHELDQAARELWDLGKHGPEQLVAELDTYCIAVRDAMSWIRIPSLTEERRVELNAIYVEPDLVDVHESASHGYGSPVLVNALSERSRIVVLGDPGGGKSTLTSATMSHFAEARLELKDSAIPFFVPLAAYARYRRQNVDAPGMARFIAWHASEREWGDFDETVVRYLLATGQGVVFFDGLDEILDLAERMAVRDVIENFARKYISSSFVTTCREVGYAETPLDPARFSRVMIPSLDLTRVQVFVDKFFKLSAMTGATEVASLKAEFIYDTQNIPDLRKNPLMLGLLCLLYETGRSIPKNQADLYKQCANLLFSQWDSRRGIKVDGAEAQTAEDAVARVALEVLLLGEEEFSQEWLECQLITYYRDEHNDSASAAERFADQVVGLWRGRRWLLVRVGTKSGVDYYKFAHRTFMEYFAAVRQAFTSSSADVLWARIGPLIESRSANVFCVLAAQIHSRHDAGSGARVLERIMDSMASANPRISWNAAAFCSEVLPVLRARPGEKAVAASEMLRVVAGMVPIENRYPSGNSAYTDVLFEYDRDGAGYSGAFASDGDRNERRTMNFSRSTLPLFSVARTAGESWDVISKSLAGAFHVATQESVDHEIVLRYSKLAAQLAVLPHTEDWAGLSDRQRELFSEWGTSVWESPSVAHGTESCFGQDFWLDVYMGREGRVSISRFLAKRGVAGALMGGWELPVAADAPPAGTVIHRAFGEIADMLRRGDVGEAGEQLRALREFLAPPLIHRNLARAGMNFESASLSVEAHRDVQDVDYSALDDRARAGMAYLTTALARMGEDEVLAPLEFSRCPVGRLIAQVAAVGRYSGEVSEAATAAEQLVDDPNILDEILEVIGVNAPRRPTSSILPS